MSQISKDDSLQWQGKFLEMHVVPWGDGGRWEYVKRINSLKAAVILAITDQRELVLVEQYRPALGKCVIELPAGLIGDTDGSEDPLASAKRELIEEAGFSAENWENIGEFSSSPGMIAETFHLYRATGLQQVGTGGGVDGEDIQVHVVPIANIKSFAEQARARGCAIDVRLLLAYGLI